LKGRVESSENEPLDTLIEDGQFGSRFQELSKSPSGEAREAAAAFHLSGMMHLVGRRIDLMEK